MTELPIFELPLVLLPGEQIPLHIFEPRYRAMVGRSLREGEPFGIILRDADGARAVGCLASVDEITEVHEDGRFNVLVSGIEPFRVIDRYEAPEWPAAEVESVGDLDLPALDADAASRARAAFSRLLERATGQAIETGRLEAMSSFAIAARVELPAAGKQALLEARDEDRRMRLLADQLAELERAVRDSFRRADRARSNGRIRFTDPGL